MLLSKQFIQGLARMRLASVTSDFLRACRSVDPCLVHTAADESMAEYLTRKVGVDFLENVVAIVYRNLWARNIEQASKAYFLMIYPHVRNRPSDLKEVHVMHQGASRAIRPASRARSAAYCRPRRPDRKTSSMPAISR
jgi:hypothetical protein